MSALRSRGTCLRRAVLLAGALAALGLDATAWTTTVPAGQKYAYMAIGTATQNANNATINTVSVSVPATALGSGAALAMTSDSAQSASVFDGFTVCTVPGQVYIAVGHRVTAANSTAQGTLSVSTPANLTNASGNTIPFSQIAWTVSNLYNNDTTLSAGAFNGGTLTMASIRANRFMEDCLAFRYLNAQVVGAGTYTGRATYTFAIP